MKGEDTRLGEAITNNIPAASAYFQVELSNKECGGGEVADYTWVPEMKVREKHNIREAGCFPEAGAACRRVEEATVLFHRCRPLQSPGSFSKLNSLGLFNTSAADCIVVLCRCCLQCGKCDSHLGTTCLRRHMNVYHPCMVAQHVNDSS